MRFTSHQRIDGNFSGRHVSRQQGGAGEFVDFREYSGGEDLRRLDWKVFGRTGKAYVRLHQDENNLACMMAIDVSGSMQFGSQSRDLEPKQSKLEYAQYLTTALSHVVTMGQDQVGLALLADRLIEYIPPGGTATHARQVHEKIELLKTHETLHMAAALKDLFERCRGRGVLFLCSDFLMEDLSEAFAQLQLYRHYRWEVIALHLVHPNEERLPEGPAFRFEGLENEGAINCTPAEIRVSYAECFDKHLASVRQFALAAGCEYRLVSTARSYVQTLQSFLVERSG